MNSTTAHLVELAGSRLNFQKNYAPKLRDLVETRSAQLGFGDSERQAALRSIDAFVWKLTAAGIHLERLWDYHESCALQQLVANGLNDELAPKRFTDNEVAFLTTEFEAYLFQARAFISVAQIHTLHACRVSFGVQLTNTEYTQVVKKAPNEVRERLIQAHNYFTQDVFGEGKWGSLLKSLRDRVVHFDRIRPSRTTLDEGAEQLTVNKRSFERLAQDFENGSYNLIVKVIAPVWEREWQAGPYYPGMWT